MTLEGGEEKVDATFQIEVNKECSARLQCKLFMPYALRNNVLLPFFFLFFLISGTFPFYLYSVKNRFTKIIDNIILVKIICCKKKEIYNFAEKGGNIGGISLSP